MDSLEECILRAVKGLERKGIDPTKTNVFQYMMYGGIFKKDWSEVELNKINHYVDIYRGDKDE
jgi:hypothetical protein